METFTTIIMLIIILAFITFMMIINAITNRSLDRVDMVGALKSAE